MTIKVLLQQLAAIREKLAAYGIRDEAGRLVAMAGGTRRKALAGGTRRKAFAGDALAPGRHGLTPGRLRLRPGRLSVVLLGGHRARLLVRRFRPTRRLRLVPGRFAGLRWRTLGHRTG